jgi:hypothetical protein
MKTVISGMKYLSLAFSSFRCYFFGCLLLKWDYYVFGSNVNCRLNLYSHLSKKKKAWESLQRDSGEEEEEEGVK